MVDSIDKVYYRIGGGRYWKIFTNFSPIFKLNQQDSISSRENYLYFSTKEDCCIAISLLSSTLFYWYFIMMTNCRDLNPSDLRNFPFSTTHLTADIKDRLLALSSNLMDSYMHNSKMKEKTSKQTGHIIYQEFYPKLSKPIIDEIDKVLAQHYGFTDEELDFIINGAD
jgi:hypothetical protein